MDTYTLLKYFECKTTEEENQSVAKWLLDSENDDNAAKYKAVHYLFLTQKLFLRNPENIKKTRKSKFLGFLWRAAVVAVLIVATYALSGIRTVDLLSEKTETVIVPAGERLQLTLADGTQMWLNSGTEVEIPVVFSRKERNIRLVEGEILLTVTKDEDRPFVVGTWNGKVEVLGTRFDVAADESRGAFSVALLEGSVKVTDEINRKEYILEPNDIATMVEGNIKVGRIKDISAIDSWSSGLIDVTDIPFDELMRKFEKAFDVRIFIDRKDCPYVRYTRGKIRVSDGIDHALSVLQLASDFSYTFDRVTNTVIIR